MYDQPSGAVTSGSISPARAQYANSSVAAPSEPVATLLHKTLEGHLNRLNLLVEQQEGLISRLFGPRPQTPESKNTGGGAPGTLADINRSLEAMDGMLLRALDNQNMLTRLG